VRGLVLVPVLAALQRGGVLAILARGERSLGELASMSGGHLGPLSVVLRGLQCEGLLGRSQHPEAARIEVALTPLGREVAALAPALAELSAALQACSWADRESRFLALSEARWELGGGQAGRRLALFLDGFLAAHPVLELRRTGRCASAFLQRLGWVGPRGEPSERGRKAASLGYTYLFPCSYAPMLASLDSLLFGESALFERSEGAPEEHLSRAQDISFSGTLSVDVCAACAYPGLLERFSGPLDRQARFLADTGCGDGRLLAALGRFVAERAPRGASLDGRPLVLVGVDQEAIAREAARATLQATGLPFLVLPGDIARPEALAQALQQAGLDPSDGLHLSKSVLHDRSYRGPSDLEAARRRQPLSSGAFLDESGAAVANAFLEQDLVETLARWRPYAARHGMLLFEAHTAEPEVVARELERNWSSAFDVVQGLSRQYPVELSVLWAALSEAGFRVQSWCDPTQGFCGFATMSMSWLEVAPRSRDGDGAGGQDG
jgi:hypothetical protein